MAVRGVPEPERRGGASDWNSFCPYPYFRGMPSRRPKSKDTPAKLASRMKRRFRIVLMRKTGQVLGTVEAADPQAAEKVAAIQFELDEFQRRRLLVQELG